VVQIVLCTVRFGNDDYAAIVGYGDYKLGDTLISRVYYVEGLKHNLFLVGQFCDGGLEVAFRQHSQLRYGGSTQRSLFNEVMVMASSVESSKFRDFERIGSK
ncbi:hypothetical protein Tco_0229503, partial [Tanacetum coccineum]